MKIRRPTLLLAAIACALWVPACGGDDLEAASEELAAMERQVEEAQAQVEAREAEARAADAALEQARKTLEQARERMAAARERVEERTNDAVVFRKVQRRLLDADDLAGVAISARVSQRVVTLEGTVPREPLKVRAEQIAAETAGVETVVNQIAVRAPGD